MMGCESALRLTILSFLSIFPCPSNSAYQQARCRVPRAAAAALSPQVEGPWPPPAWAPLPPSASPTSTLNSQSSATPTFRTNWTPFCRRVAPPATGRPAPSPPSTRTRSPPASRSAGGRGWASEPKRCGCRRRLTP